MKIAQRYIGRGLNIKGPASIYITQANALAWLDLMKTTIDKSTVHTEITKITYICLKVNLQQGTNKTKRTKS